MEKSHPGAKIEIHHKNPKDGELDPQQKRKNRALNGRRIVVEHVMYALRSTIF